MSSDRLKPDEIDAAIAATRDQGRRPGLRLDPDDLTPLEADYRLRVRGHADDEKEVQLNDQTDGSDIPTYPGRLRPDITYSDRDLGPERGARRRRVLPMLIAGFALMAFAAVIWWAYGTETVGDPGSAPLITAEEGAEKFRPEDEGGMEVPNQDKLIYSQIGGDEEGGESQVERLLPPPETPLELAAPVVVDPVVEQGMELGSASGETAPAAMAEATPTQDAPAESTVAEGAPPPPAVATKTVEMPADQAAASTAPEPEKPAPAESAESKVSEVPATPEPKAPVTAESAPQVAAAPSGFRIQLAALRSRDAAQAEWGNLQRRFPALLEQLQLNVQHVDLGDKGVFYRVQAGPLSDRTAAQSLCSRFKEQKQACLIVAP